jgi:hypothetical protein
MPSFAIYRRSKRRNDLVLVRWPVMADDRARAELLAAETLRASGESPKRLHAIEHVARNALDVPPVRVRADGRVLRADHVLDHETWAALYQNAPAVREPPPP